MTHHGEDLPIADYDQLRTGDLGHRIRSLGREDLRRVREYERAHAARPQVLMMLTAREDALAAGAEQSFGGAAETAPAGGRHGSPVSPATAAPPHSPPPHGTPHQSGKPKGNR
ncbi:hypothetical protein [Streptomyces sp. 7-21]|uniref:hypothetical protein n=1 Tax=Streptomyces sp. 7-21 TaxID=2802283 RepID=UPI00191E9D84|nr:hypothetical protein [Streptomyces sp. 7-21]MBL1065224.1 hypothetical protein [Streptomyces sp. 7-21]